MLKNKQTIIAGTFVFTMLASAVGWGLMSEGSSTAHQDQQLENSSDSSMSSSGEGSLNVTRSSNGISLLSPEAGSQAAAGGSSQNTNSNGIGLNPQSFGGNSKNRSSAEAMLNPSTFKQYEKHKDAQAALYSELLAGEGDELTAGKKAAVYYKGWLTDGSLFDMSRPNEDDELEPFVFEMGAGQVIPGWEQALEGMKVGGVRFLIVPPAVGYGAQGQDPIPPDSVLIFQVQLLAVE